MSSGDLPRQLVLPLGFERDYRTFPFIAAPSNAAARAWLAAPAAWPAGRLALFGESGSGKTHLLHAWAAARGGAVWQAAELRWPLAPLPAGGLALDDAECCAEEEALLHLLNRAAEEGVPLLLAARSPPARWPVRLPDLESRLRGMAAVAIGPADDALLEALFIQLAEARQLRVPAAVRQYLLTRLPRTPAAVREAIARLDRRALAEGRAISRQLASAVLADLAAEAGEEGEEREGGAEETTPLPLLFTPAEAK
jgi:chromosomal replication initiation ATPase DnaA